MGRNLILCLDGTGGQFVGANTNVLEIYAMIDRQRNDQLSYYQPGIGTFAPPGVWGRLRKWFLTRLDLAIAWMLEEHVTDAYRFLMRYYQDGDRIFIFGFSRGAYTARALAAMLFKVGLLTQGNEELIPFAWAVFKREREGKLYTRFRHTFCRKATVHFLGLWDTVSSIGWFWNPQYLQFTANNPIVKTVRHAVALDERRAYFVQNLWGHDPHESTDILQGWFPGTHGDVGGGSVEAEAGLSKIALKWMLKQAKAFGLGINPTAEAVILPVSDTPDYVAPNPTAILHESLYGLWWIVEFLPKRIKDPAAGFATRWIIHSGRHRYVAPNPNVHQSVIDRKKQVSGYQPPNLPTAFTVIE